MSSTDVSHPPSELSPASADIGRGPARYLFVIFELSTDDAERITTGDLQTCLDVTPASVTEMVSKLDERGLVDYEKYQGVTLTEAGDTLATRVAWRFCVVTGFFDTVLETALDDQTAFDIGYVLPEAGIFRLRELVSSPCLDLCPESSQGTDCCVA